MLVRLATNDPQRPHDDFMFHVSSMNINQPEPEV